MITSGTMKSPPPRELALYIDGQWQRSHSSKFQEISNPATGE
jgi:hypothetical protein